MIFDSESAHLASAISQQQTNKALIIQHNISAKKWVNKIDTNYANTIIISILSQPPLKVLQFFLKQYDNHLINLYTKHLCITRTQFVINRGDKMWQLIKMFQRKNIQFVLLESNDDFIAHSYLWPYSTKSFNDVQKNHISSNSTNVRELIFPNDVRNTIIAYFYLSYNPPYVYQVQDFHNGSVFVGGIEIRMMEMLMDRWNWTVQFYKPDHASMARINCRHCEEMQRQIDHRFKTNLRTNRRHPIKTCHLYRTMDMYPDSLYSFTATQTMGWDGALYLSSFAWERLVIVVPTEWELSAIIWRSIFRSPLFNVWIFQILLFSIVRMVLQKCSIYANARRFMDIFFDTFGLTFGVSSDDASSYTNRPERILILFFVMSAFLSSILWSGTLFEQFASGLRTGPTINSLSDLMAQRERKQFCIPPAYGVEFYEFQRQFGPATMALEFDIMYYIFSGNLSFFYMLPESRAIQLLTDAGGDEVNRASKLFHIVPDLYLCELRVNL